MGKPAKHAGVVLGTIFLLTLTSRLIHLAWLGPEARVEHRHYENWEIAQNLLAGNGYSLDGTSPTAHKPPVYPFFLALMVRLFGPEPFLAIRVIQSVVFSAATALSFLLFMELLPVRWAAFATALVGVSPFLAKAHFWIDSVSFSIALILLVLWLAIRAARDGTNLRNFVVLGFVGGLLSLTLSTAFCVVPVIAVWLCFQLPRPMVARGLGIYLLGVAVPLLPWTARNALEFGRLMPLTSNFKLELWIGNNPDATGGMKDQRGEAVTLPRGELAKRVADLSEVERNDVLGREALQFVMDHPAKFVTLRWNAAFYFFCTQNYWIEDVHSTRRVLAKTLVVLQSLLAFVGCAAAIWKRDSIGILIASCLLSFSAIYVLTHGDIGDRYRLPIDPLLILFSVYAIHELWRVCHLGLVTLALKRRS